MCINDSKLPDCNHWFSSRKNKTLVLMYNEAIQLFYKKKFNDMGDYLEY